MLLLYGVQQPRDNERLVEMVRYALSITDGGVNHHEQSFQEMRGRLVEYQCSHHSEARVSLGCVPE